MDLLSPSLVTSKCEDMKNCSFVKHHLQVCLSLFYGWLFLSYLVSSLASPHLAQFAIPESLPWLRLTPAVSMSGRPMPSLRTLMLSACRMLRWSSPVHQWLLEVQEEVVKDQVCIDGGLVGLGAAQQVGHHGLGNLQGGHLVTMHSEAIWGPIKT